MSDSRGMERMRIAAATAMSGLRQHRATSVLLILIAAVGLGAALPVAGLMTWPGDQFSRLRWVAGSAGPEQGWAVARTAGALHEEGLRLLFQALFGVALAAFAISAVAAVLVFAARAGERSGEITLRRAVGARRRTLLLAAWSKGDCLPPPPSSSGARPGWRSGALPSPPGRGRSCPAPPYQPASRPP